MIKRTRFRKVILSGGYVTSATDGGIAFCSEIVRDLPSPVKILECLFGRSTNLWASAIKDDQELFRKVLPGIHLEFDIAKSQNFVEQLKWADVVYFRGGETQKLLDRLKKIHGWQNALEDKTLVGSSAGAYVISAFYIQASTPPSIKRGFGLVPIKIVAHYRSLYHHNNDIGASLRYWNHVDRIMKTEQQQLRSVYLGDGEFEVIEPDTKRVNPN